MATATPNEQQQAENALRIMRAFIKEYNTWMLALSKLTLKPPLPVPIPIFLATYSIRLAQWEAEEKYRLEIQNALKQTTLTYREHLMQVCPSMAGVTIILKVGDGIYEATFNHETIKAEEIELARVREILSGAAEETSRHNTPKLHLN